jgi:hypothetical protein
MSISSFTSDPASGIAAAIFPTTRLFSEFARSTVPDVDPVTDPDGALMASMEREEILFRTLEKHIVAERLTKGFDGDNEGDIHREQNLLRPRRSDSG